MKKLIAQNKEPIVDLREGPFAPTEQYVTAYKDNKIYVHVLSWNGKNNLLLPAITDRVVKNAWLMGQSTEWDIVRQHPWGLLIIVPEVFQSGGHDIVVLEIEGEPASLEKPQLIDADPASAISLFGDSAKVDGGLVHLQAQDWIEGWDNPSALLSWKVKLPSASDYNVALTYAAERHATDDLKFQIVAGDSEVIGTVRETTGWAGHSQNFEKISLPEKLHLPAGESTITLRLICRSDLPIATRQNVKIHSLELMSPTAAKAMRAARERAQKLRANTDWFVKAKYGVMFHWSTTTQPLRGSQKPYPEAVEAFDVEAFADMVRDTGAGYVIFTAVHGIMHFPAPLQSIEKVMPGRTCNRDLIQGIADSLSRHGIPLILYFHHGVGDSEWVKAAGFLSRDKSRFFNIEREILTEIGLRYGKKVVGYWFDDRYPLQPYEELFQATKVGNPDRIVAWNSWILPKTTAFQEYYAGEFGGTLIHPPANYFAPGGSASGLQPHALIFLDDPWQHGYPNTDIAAPLFTTQQLIDYVKTCISQKLVITMNMGITQDGKVSLETLEQLKALRQTIRE